MNKNEIYKCDISSVFTAFSNADLVLKRIKKDIDREMYMIRKYNTEECNSIRTQYKQVELAIINLHNALSSSQKKVKEE